MKNLEQIKNEYAQEQGYANWENLQFDTLSDGEEIEEHMNEVAKRYATEAVKEALEKASENAIVVMDFVNDWHKVDKQSILNTKIELK